MHLIHTYTPGPRIRSGRLTKAAITRICKRLTSKWGWVVRPEGIGGGFLLVEVPVGYKSWRMRGQGTRWPWIVGDELVRWEGDEEVLHEDLAGADCFLKGFDGCWWTQEEVEDVVAALEDEGVVVEHWRTDLTYPLEQSEPWQVWERAVRNLKPGDVIDDPHAVGLISLDDTEWAKTLGRPIKRTFFGAEAGGQEIDIQRCVDAYFKIRKEMRKAL